MKIDVIYYCCYYFATDISYLALGLQIFLSTDTPIAKFAYLGNGLLQSSLFKMYQITSLLVDFTALCLSINYLLVRLVLLLIVNKPLVIFCKLVI